MTTKTNLSQQTINNISNPTTQNKTSNWSGRKVEILVGGALIIAGAATAALLTPLALTVSGVGAAILMHGYLRTPSKNLEENKVTLLPPLPQQEVVVAEAELPPVVAQAAEQPETPAIISQAAEAPVQAPEPTTLVEIIQPQVESPAPTLNERMFALLGTKPYNEETATDADQMIHDMVEAFEEQDVKAFKFLLDEFAQSYPNNAPAVAANIRQFANEQISNLLGANPTQEESASEMEQMLHDLIETFEQQDEKTFKFILEEFADIYPSNPLMLEPVKNFLAMSEHASIYLSTNEVTPPFKSSEEKPVPSEIEEPKENSSRKRMIAGGLAMLAIAGAVAGIAYKVTNTPARFPAPEKRINNPSPFETPAPRPFVAPQQCDNPSWVNTTASPTAPVVSLGACPEQLATNATARPAPMMPEHRTGQYLFMLTPEQQAEQAKQVKQQLDAAYAAHPEWYSTKPSGCKMLS